MYNYVYLFISYIEHAPSESEPRGSNMSVSSVKKRNKTFKTRLLDWSKASSSRFLLIDPNNNVCPIIIS